MAGLGNRFQIHGGFWVVQSARTMTPALTIGVTDLKSWSQFGSTRPSPPTRPVPIPIRSARWGDEAPASGAVNRQ